MDKFKVRPLPNNRSQLRWLVEQLDHWIKELIDVDVVLQLVLDGPVAYAVLNAAHERNREGSEIPLRRDLADDLR